MAPNASPTLSLQLDAGLRKDPIFLVGTLIVLVSMDKWINPAVPSRSSGLMKELGA